MIIDSIKIFCWVINFRKPQAKQVIMTRGGSISVVVEEGFKKLYISTFSSKKVIGSLRGGKWEFDTPECRNTFSSLKKTFGKDIQLLVRQAA